MRVLHVISSLDPSAGGPPMVVSRLAAAQARQGHDVHLVCYRVPKAEKEVQASLAKLPGGDVLKVHFLDPADRKEWYFSTRARAEMGRLLREGSEQGGGESEQANKRASEQGGGTDGAPGAPSDPSLARSIPSPPRSLARSTPSFDAVHLHGLWDPILKAGADVAWKHRVPYVIAPHGMLDAWALSEKPLKKKIALALGYKTMIRRAGLMHALSEYERECIAAHGWNPRVSIIPNGVFLEEIEPLPPKGEFYAKHPELGPRDSAPFVLFLARLHAVKGIDLLVEAMAANRARHPEVRLVVAGPDFGVKAELEAQIARLNLADRVFLVGPLWGQDKLAALSDACCFCLPSKHEGFSMAIAEALAARLPVVITQNCHFPEVAQVGAGLVVERDVAQIARGLDQVLSDEASRRAMGAAGRSLIESRYTWDRVAHKSIEEYGRLARG